MTYANAVSRPQEVLGRDQTVLLTCDEAANYLRTSKSYLAKQRIAGDGPIFCKIGRRVMYRVQDLESWLSGRRRSSTSAVDAP